MTMIDLSNHLLATADRNDLPVTNLQLQKVLYFIIKDYIKENNIDDFISTVYDIPFEAWPYGPVVRDLYFEYNIFGSDQITDVGSINEQYEVFTPNIITRLKQNVYDLVDSTHKEIFWKSNKDRILKHDEITYRLENIRDGE
ncbi:Panacea domain-containing protein [Latilactobacillus sp. 5-91]|uniref:Panacea domain-containing protein n=1 Tax=Latilactobacillus sp. 5-91 TaxID=3410924 RepID=UPI003C79284E